MVLLSPLVSVSLSAEMVAELTALLTQPQLLRSLILATGWYLATTRPKSATRDWQFTGDSCSWLLATWIMLEDWMSSSSWNYKLCISPVIKTGNIWLAQRTGPDFRMFGPEWLSKFLYSLYPACIFSLKRIQCKTQSESEELCTCHLLVPLRAPVVLRHLFSVFVELAKYGQKDQTSDAAQASQVAPREH